MPSQERKNFKSSPEIQVGKLLSVEFKDIQRFFFSVLGLIKRLFGLF